MSVWAADENNLNTKHNQKLRTIGNGSQLAAIPITYEGQLIFCTESTSSFPKNKLRSRMTGNSSWSGILAEGSETADSDHITTNASEIIGATVQDVRFITLPSTDKFYMITKFEWKNGSVVSGNVMMGANLCNANPATLNSTPLVAIGQEVAQSGTSSLQSVAVTKSLPVRGGSHLAIWIISSNSTGQFAKDNTSQTNYDRSVAYTANPPMSWNTGFVAPPTGYDTDFICYYRGYS